MYKLNDKKRNKSEMGEYVIWLVENGYAAWDENAGAYVFVDRADTSKIMKEYMNEIKKEKNETYL